MRNVDWTGYAVPVTLRLNLAALTEAELLALYGPAGVQARFPEISRARLQGQPVLNGEVPTDLLLREVPPGEAAGITPQQSLTLKQVHAALLEAGAQGHSTFLIPPETDLAFLRAYVLKETAISVRWREAPGTPRDAAPSVSVLTWLRDRASGVACVLSMDAGQPPGPAYSEEIAVHVHPHTSVPELLRLHRQHVARHGKPQKLAPEGGWRSIWQALHDLNIKAWLRRGVLVETAS